MKTVRPTIGIIGGGNMGTAILSGIHKAYPVIVCEQDKKKCRFLKRTFKLSGQSLRDVIEQAQIIILAVKPQNFDELLQEIESTTGKKKLFISIAAGITTSYIEKRLQRDVKVIRTMPNLPAQIGQGMTAVCGGKSASFSDIKRACQIFNHIGKTVVVKEEWMDAITAVSGSGPAYVFLFIECFTNAAVSLGLSEDLGKALVLQTFRGSWGLFEQQREEASELRARVTSQGGTTQAAVDVFMKYHLEGVFREALQAARNRARELVK